MGERVIAVTWTTDWEIAAGFAHGHRSIAVSAPVIDSVALCQSGPTQLSTEVPTLTLYLRAYCGFFRAMDALPVLPPT